MLQGSGPPRYIGSLPERDSSSRPVAVPALATTANDIVAGLNAREPADLPVDVLDAAGNLLCSSNPLRVTADAPLQSTGATCEFYPPRRFAPAAVGVTFGAWTIVVVDQRERPLRVAL